MTDRGGAGSATPSRPLWQNAPIVAVRPLTPTVKSFVLRVEWPNGFRAGQYVDVRLTAPGGYQAQRSYSVASSPSDAGTIELMVERLDDGEVSGFFHDVAEPGDSIELRGPIGGPFTWGPADGGPLLLAGGGSGVVPLLSMLRLRAEAAPDCPAVLLYSARRLEAVIARDELLRRADAEPGFRLMLHLTRDEAAIPGTVARRIDAAAVADALAGFGGAVPRCFVCGSNAFVGSAADLLVDAGVPPGRIRTERFGG